MTNIAGAIMASNNNAGMTNIAGAIMASNNNAGMTNIAGAIIATTNNLPGINHTCCVGANNYSPRQSARTKP